MSTSFSKNWTDAFNSTVEFTIRMTLNSPQHADRRLNSLLSLFGSSSQFDRISNCVQPLLITFDLLIRCQLRSLRQSVTSSCRPPQNDRSFSCSNSRQQQQHLQQPLPASCRQWCGCSCGTGRTLSVMVDWPKRCAWEEANSDHSVDSSRSWSKLCDYWQPATCSGDDVKPGFRVRLKLSNIEWEHSSNS